MIIFIVLLILLFVLFLKSGERTVKKASESRSDISSVRRLYPSNAAATRPDQTRG